MKYLVNILIAGAAIFALASCSHVAPYTGEDFVAFYKGSYTVNESSGSFKIPVKAYPQNGTANTSVSFKVVEGTAKSGTNFTVEPASGVLTFAGDSTQYITVSVIDKDGVFTGDLGFSIEIASTTNDYIFPNYNTVKVTIKDEDHPLLDLFGSYTMGGVVLSTSGSRVEEWDMEVSAYEDDVTRIWLDITAPLFSPSIYGGSFKNTPSVYAVVSDDKATITIPYPQATAASPSDLFSGFTADDVFYFYGWDDEGGKFITSEGSIVFTKQADGSYETPDYYGFTTPDEVGGMFYYWMNAWGAYFVKK